MQHGALNAAGEYSDGHASRSPFHSQRVVVVVCASGRCCSQRKSHALKRAWCGGRIYKPPQQEAVNSVASLVFPSCLLPTSSMSSHPLLRMVTIIIAGVLAPGTALVLAPTLVPVLDPGPVFLDRPRVTIISPRTNPPANTPDIGAEEVRALAARTPQALAVTQTVVVVVAAVGMLLRLVVAAAAAVKTTRTMIPTTTTKMTTFVSPTPCWTRSFSQSARSLLVTST